MESWSPSHFLVQHISAPLSCFTRWNASFQGVSLVWQLQTVAVSPPLLPELKPRGGGDSYDPAPMSPGPDSTPLRMWAPEPGHPRSMADRKSVV